MNAFGLTDLSALPATTNQTAHWCFLVPGDWNLPTGGYTYDRRIVMGLRSIACSSANSM